METFCKIGGDFLAIVLGGILSGGILLEGIFLEEFFGGIFEDNICKCQKELT